MAQRIGLHEDRTRVTCHLPLNDPAQEKAITRIIDYLKAQRLEPIGVKGFTHSNFRPTSFYGYWWSSKRQHWVEDKIVLFIIDYKLGLGDPRLSNQVQDLKDKIRQCYAGMGSPQDEIWVVAQQITRQD